MKVTTILSIGAATAAIMGAPVGGAHAASDPSQAHQTFMQAFNERNWEEVRSLLGEDSVFHRANAEDVYVGPDAIVGRFEDTIGASDQWNVKFVRLDTSEQVSGSDGRVVERGDFAITAGAEDEACYVGSYMMTWAPADGNGWQLQALGWQDVETDAANCR